MSFRGPSAQAAAALSEKLQQVLTSGPDAARVGDQLFEVSQLVRSEGSLRRFVTDPSVANSAKEELIASLFGGKVEPTTLELLNTAVSHRWTAPRDLADAVEITADEATVRSADDAGRVETELFELGRVVHENPNLRDALSDPSRSAQDKAQLLDDLLSGKAVPATVTLAKRSLAGTYRTVGAALEAYQQLAAKVQGQGVATVRVARPLTDADTQRLAQALSRQYGRTVHLNVIVDPALVGGIRVEIGDEVIDGSVSSRLDDARRRLAG